MLIINQKKLKIGGNIMKVLVYTFLILLVLACVFKLYKDYKLVILKYNILYMLDTPDFNFNDLDFIKDKAPNFYNILKNLRSVSFSGINFTDFKQNTKRMDKNKSDELNLELENLSKNKKINSMIVWYKCLCAMMYFYDHPYKYMLFLIVAKFTHKNEKKCIENTNDGFGLSY